MKNVIMYIFLEKSLYVLTNNTKKIAEQQTMLILWWNIRIISLPRPTQERLLEDSKLEVLKRRRPEDGILLQRISRSNSNTSALHSVCIFKHKNGNIDIFWKLNHNIHNWLFYAIFCIFSTFCSKNFTILGIFTNILSSWDNLERMWNIWRSQENSWEVAVLNPQGSTYILGQFSKKGNFSITSIFFLFEIV